jgi:hypothetical protein
MLRIVMKHRPRGIGELGVDRKNKHKTGHHHTEI